jgi:hypothetical protein
MPKFSETPLQTNEDVDNWLRFFEVHAPFTNFSVFVNRDPVIVTLKILYLRL